MINNQIADKLIEISKFYQMSEEERDVMQFAALELRTLEQQKTGRWILVHPLQEDDGGSYMCDRCKCGHPYISPSWKFCPNCGAKMIEVQESEVKG